MAEENTVEVHQEESKKIMRIGRGEPIFRIVFATVIAIVLLGFPYIIGFWASELLWVPVSYLASPRGFWIPLFNLATLNSLAILVILWTLACIIGEVIKLVISCYNRNYALTTTISGVLVLIFTAIMFFNPRIMNPDFVPLLNEYLNDAVGSFAATLLNNANIVIFIVIFIVVVVENLLAWHRAAKYGGTYVRKTEEVAE